MLARVGVVWVLIMGGWGCVCYRCMGAGVIGTYIGVEAVVLRSWCICSEIQILVRDHDTNHDSHDDIDTAESLHFFFRNVLPKR